MLLRSMQNTRRLADAKLKMMLCVMMLPLVVVGCIKAVCRSVRETTTTSGVDNATSPDWQEETLPLNGIISPLRRLIL